MNKNLIPEVLKLLGVEYDERFKLTNTDKNKKQESGSFTFTPNSSTELTAYYDEISAGESVDVKITFADKKVINMTDYKLTNLETGTNDKI